MSRYVILSFVALGMLLWMLIGKGLGALWETLKWNNLRILGDKLTLTDLIGFGFGALLVLFLMRHEGITRLAEEISSEMKKVTWPTKAELKAATIVVIIFVFVMSFILGLMDAFWSKLTSWIY